MVLLSQNEITEALKNLAGWELRGVEIVKVYKFRDFPEAIGFTNRVAILAEKADHHPDIAINYNRVTLVISTHSEGGITDKDVKLAARIDGN